MSTKIKAPTTYGTAVTYLNKLFDLCNDKFFNAELPKPTITIQSSPNAYGHVWSAKIWHSTVNGREVNTYELNIDANSLDRKIVDVIATLLHEMVHLYCLENEIKDTSNNGVYHNKRFKKECESHGLNVEQSKIKPASGWSATIPTDETVEWITGLGLKDFQIGRVEIEKKKKKSKSNSIKWSCPECGAIIRSTRRFDIAPICGDCLSILGELIYFEESN